ncbi:MAG: hypothetical protein QM661_14935 [Solimonas sp.]
MTDIVRMSAERSRFSPSAAFLARVSTSRRYIHGDEHETARGTYYCCFRDLFLPEDAFRNSAHDHHRQYLASLQAFRSDIEDGDFIPRVYRPSDASNLLSPAKAGLNIT